jgi:lipoate-protein ligase A
MVNTKSLYYQGMSKGKIPKKMAKIRRERQAASKQQAASVKPEDLHAENTKAFEPTRSSIKQQAASPEQQAPSDKPRD